ncbi:MAG: ribonuclease R [Clostridia bacterium]|nr:ribonuclease R [Clostridia bacterium]
MQEDLFINALDFIKEHQLYFRTRTELARNLSEGLGLEYTNSYALIGKLIEMGDLVIEGHDKLATPEALGLRKGVLIGNARGFAFCKFTDGGETPDVFIPPVSLKTALHNDVVLVKVRKNGDRSEGQVVKVVERSEKNIVGTLDIVNPNLAFVKPDDTRYFKDIVIRNHGKFKVKAGDKVVCRITKYVAGDKNPQGVLTEVLGLNGDPKIEMLAIIRENNLYEEFEPDVLAEARKLPQSVPVEATRGRRDFTGDNIVTIDSADTRDIDDAVGIVEHPDGHFTLSVHIADVSEYVKQNSPLDNEAYKRGTSVYFPDLVYPMLPRELSNGICSLNPKVTRLTLSVIMEIDEQGEVYDYEICEGFIKSREKMTYDDVFAIFNDDPQVCAKYSDMVKDFKAMQKLHRILSAKRKRRGALEFDLPECKFEMDSAGHVLEVKLFERNEAHMMIESFMLEANETVALACHKEKLPFLFRVHEQPDGQKMFDFFQFASQFGLKVANNPDKVTPKDLQRLLKTVEGQPYEMLINSVMLRSLQKARYAPKNLGHFGIAAVNYCHFTSPIRRYPDLLIHRIIKKFYLRNKDKKALEYYREFVEEASDLTSEREKLAESAERQVDDLKKADYMQNHIGEIYEGTVTGATNFGVFVALPNTVEGMCPLENLPTDNYVFIEKLYKLAGSKHDYQLGQKVRIQVESVNLRRRQINFKILED